MKKKILLIFVLLFLIFSQRTLAVYFATDTVHLYEDGKHINNSSFTVYSDVCEEGVCYIGQQFYPVTISNITDEEFNLTFDPGPSKGGEGNRIGDHRKYNLDIKSGEYIETTTKKPFRIFNSIKDISIIISGIVQLVLIFLISSGFILSIVGIVRLKVSKGKKGKKVLIVGLIFLISLAIWALIALFEEYTGICFGISYYCPMQIIG